MSNIKYLVLLFLAIIIYTTTFATEYTVPRAAYSVYSEDLDLDGDKDIVVGHLYNSSTNWTGITTLENINAEFSNIDSFYLNGQHRDLCIEKIDNNNDFDLITQYYNGTNSQIGILFDFYENQNNLFTYDISDYAEHITIGDIDNDNDIDIVVASNNGFFWGYLLNNGNGEFSLPIYYDLSFPPGCIACDDLNGDFRDDIVVGGSQIIIYYSYQTGLDSMSVNISAYLTDLEICDIDNDGDNDIIAADWGIPGSPKRVLVYSNDGNCNFDLSYSKWIDEAMAEIFVSDLNNDIFPDIIYNVSYSYPNSNYERTHTYILYNNGDNTFDDPINYQTYSGSYEYTASLKSFATDVDCNGLKDIITVNYSYNGDNNVNILFQNDAGNFVENPQNAVDPQYPPISEVNLSIYPNPFNINTMINFSIKEQGFVELKIYDIKGRLIKQVINQKMKGGEHNVNWNGKDENNQWCSSGVYLVNLKLNGVSKRTKKVIILK